MNTPARQVPAQLKVYLSVGLIQGALHDSRTMLEHFYDIPPSAIFADTANIQAAKELPI